MGILRLIIIVILFILIYYVLKGMTDSGEKRGKARPARTRPSFRGGGEEQFDELVQDPRTGVFFPRSEGVASLVEGRVLYFVNSESRDQYLKERQSKRKGGAK